MWNYKNKKGVSKSLLIVVAIETNNLKSWFIQERNTVIAQRRKTVYGIIFVVEMEQKQAIWGL